MYHTLVRLLVEVSESLRKDFSSMAEGNSYSTVRRVRKHLTNLRKITKEMSAATNYKKEKKGRIRTPDSIRSKWNTVYL